jgi:hypothetical protein
MKVWFFAFLICFVSSTVLANRELEEARKAAKPIETDLIRRRTLRNFVKNYRLKKTPLQKNEQAIEDTNLDLTAPFPEELCSFMASFLPPYSLSRLARVNHKWERIAKEVEKNKIEQTLQRVGAQDFINFAVPRGYCPGVEYLVKNKKIDVSNFAFHQPGSGFSALELAAQHGRIRVLRFLLQRPDLYLYRCDTAKDCRLNTSTQLISATLHRYGYPHINTGVTNEKAIKIVHLILFYLGKAHPNLHQALFNSISRGSLPLVRLLVRQGIDLKKKILFETEKPRTARELAEDLKQFEIAEYIKKQGG